MTASADYPPTLLEVRDLRVEYSNDGESPVAALDGVSFTLGPGEALGLLGESGCGKSSLAQAIPGLLPSAGRIAQGSVSFRGQRLDQLGERRLEKIRGAEIALILQDPTLALHPLHRIGEQIVEVIRAHRSWGKQRCRERARRLLAEVGLSETDGLDAAYPHQLSGGQRQRVVIAQALACEPALLIADEPTASLDVTTQARILRLLHDLKRRYDLALLLISHDPQVVTDIADRILVMYAGRLIEQGPAERIASHPLHPYTEALWRCIPPLPSPDSERAGRELPAIPGTAPSPTSQPAGCRFAPRCPRRMTICTERSPEGVPQGADHTVHCFLHHEDIANHA